MKNKSVNKTKKKRRDLPLFRKIRGEEMKNEKKKHFYFLRKWFCLFKEFS